MKTVNGPFGRSLREGGADHNLIEYVGELREFYGTLLVVFLDGAEIECKNEEE